MIALMRGKWGHKNDCSLLPLLVSFYILLLVRVPHNTRLPVTNKGFRMTSNNWFPVNRQTWAHISSVPIHFLSFPLTICNDESNGIPTNWSTNPLKTANKRWPYNDSTASVSSCSPPTRQAFQIVIQQETNKQICQCNFCFGQFVLSFHWTSVIQLSKTISLYFKTLTIMCWPSKTLFHSHCLKTPFSEDDFKKS